MNRRDALKSLLATPGIGSVAVASIQPNDVIVVKVPVGISDKEAVWIQEQARDSFPGHKVLVMSRDLNLEIKRPA